MTNGTPKRMFAVSVRIESYSGRKPNKQCKNIKFSKFSPCPKER
jgi:hypothetical protein